MKCTSKTGFLLLSVTSVIWLLIINFCISARNRHFMATPFRRSIRSDIKRIFCASRYFSEGPAGWKAVFPLWGSFEPVQCFGSYKCQWTSDSSIADALLFHLPDERLSLWRYQWSRKASQAWIALSMESPMNYPASFLSLRYDLTASYMRHSDVWAPYSSYINMTKEEPASKTNSTFYDPSEKVYFAFIVLSNCAQDRMDFLQSLRSHIDIHVYGQCGRPLGDSHSQILELSRSYRYYLSFENSLCRDYITEKFWRSGLQGYAIPVAHGGMSRRDYEEVAPPGSFIHTSDFKDGQHLANFLKHLASNETAYSSYFEWKRYFKIVSSDVMCGICRKLHTHSNASTTDFNTFWDVSKNCDRNYNHFKA